MAAMMAQPFARSQTASISWNEEAPIGYANRGFEGASHTRIRSLTMTYSRMGRPHTTIGAEPFHF